MKTGFKDRTALPEASDKAIKSPYNFDSPPYDQRSSCFVSAGTNYGIAKNQPVGKFKADGPPGVPMGRVNTMETAYVSRNGSTRLDVYEKGQTS